MTYLDGSNIAAGRADSGQSTAKVPSHWRGRTIKEEYWSCVMNHGLEVGCNVDSVSKPKHGRRESRDHITLLNDS